MNIIPKPLHEVVKEQTITIGKASKITGDFADTKKFAKKLLSGYEGGENAEIKFLADDKISKEGYVMICDKNGKLITISASTEAGAFYGLMTLSQLLGTNNTIHCVDIQDSPKYPYRGFMLDCARHFWTTDKIKQILDIMASLKMNIFHWHLSEDQGWRAEIKKYPLLTQKGCIRKDTPLSLKGYFQNKEPHDGKEYGAGLFYSQDDMREIVAYAGERHIEVVPEIDMPGHMVAAIACYPELSCTGEPTEVSNRWGVMDNICCCGKDNIYNFAKDVIDELCEIFPGRFFHIGGDEVPKTRWEKCPKCQAKIKELGLKDENALQGYFNNQISEYLKTKGKRMIGWNEVLDAHEIMDKDTLVQWWIKRKANKNEFAWMEKGGKLLLSMVNYVYMDHPYNVRPLAKTYSLSAEKLGVMNDENIFGMEIPQWTEYIPNEAKLDMLTFARLVAFSEVCWTSEKKKDYKDFENRLENMRDYFRSINCNICPQKIYRGKTYPRKCFTNALRWNLWRTYPNYEFDEMKKMQEKDKK